MSFVTTTLRFAVAALALAACDSTGPDDPCRDVGACDSAAELGAPFPTGPDGRVVITAAQAWPDRSAEPAPLTADETARACALLVACYPPDATDGETTADARRDLMAMCLEPALAFFFEERAVPGANDNERWVFEARALLQTTGECEAVRAVKTLRAPAINCEEAGCWWTSATEPIPTVTCDGEVATLTTLGRAYTRDCSRALQRCDPSSPTGCTDRRPLACDPAARAGCEGDIRLGCDSTGKVTFHDCARVPGGHCELAGESAKCIYPDAAVCTPSDTACVGASLSACVFGAPSTIDCGGLGLADCTEGTCPAR
jgi:hypothetical protein